jgi:hypothetical protein
MNPMTGQLSNLSRHMTENGLAFLARSVGELTTQTTTQPLSFAVADLAVAIEVLMKARLVREHWSLICVDPDKVTPAKILLGDFRTVSPEQAVIRLENAVGVPLKAGKWDQRVSEISRLRNRVMHFALVGLEPVGLQAAAGRGLDFLLWLLGSQFAGQGDAETQKLVSAAIDELSEQIGKLTHLLAERMKTIEAELDAAEICVECARCSQPTMTLLDGEVARCPFCLWTPLSGAEAAAEYAEAFLGRSMYDAVTSGGEYPAVACPNCGDEALVSGIVQLRPAGPPTADWGCFACGFTAQSEGLDSCARCDTITLAESDGATLCGSCLDELWSKD